MSAASVFGSVPLRHRTALLLAAFYLAYLLGAWVGGGLILSPALGVAAWPASGLYMGVLARRGTRDIRPWIAVAIAADMTASLVWFSFTPGLALLVAAGNSLEAWAGASMLRRWAQGPFRLRAPRDAMALLILGATVAPLGSVLLGGTFVGMHTGTPLTDSWRLWWTGDAVGIIIFAPLVLSAGPRAWKVLMNCALRDLAVVGALALTVATVAHICLGQEQPLAFLVLPLVAWAALRFGVIGSALVSTLLLFEAVFYAKAGMGPFVANYSTGHTQLAIQVLGIGCALTGLIIAVSVAQTRRLRERAEANLATRTADLRERKRQLGDALAELKLVDARKDNFLSVLAHELLNPISVLRNACELQARPLAPGREAGVRDMMARQVAMLEMLAGDLLDLARVRAGKVLLETARVSTREVVMSAVESVQGRFEARSQTLLVVLADGIQVEGDARRLSQVVLNLLANACRHCPEGTKVQVRNFIEAGMACIEVVDDGPGIPPDRIETIFNLYEQVNRSSNEGLGLGLSLSCQLVKLHGGTLQAASDFGVGTRFIIRLPMK